MCGVARDKACDSDIVPPLEAAMPPSITVGSEPPKPATEPGEQQPPQQPPASKEITTIDLSADEGNDDLQKAIALSLQDQQETPGLQGISAEEQEVSRALEASLKESQPQATIETLNPRERMREHGSHIGMKNIGNSCWFNVVIQPLFHIPQFRDLILKFNQSVNGEECMSVEENQKISKHLVPSLRRLFALMLGSEKKYIDPVECVTYCQGQQEMRKNAQQDVCEFTHKLLERLEEEYQHLSRMQGVEKESTGLHVSKDADFDNPIMQLFYGQYKKEVCEEDGGPKQETFGQYPLQVMQYEDIHESILASMSSGMPTQNSRSENVEPVQQENWFKMLPPVLIFSLSRYEYSLKKQRAEKVHNKFDFPEFLYMDRYMEINKKIIKEKHIKVAKLKSELNTLMNTLDRYLKYGNGEAKYPISDILKYTLDFAQKGLVVKQESETNSIASPSRMEIDVGDVPENQENDIEMSEASEIKKDEIEMKIEAISNEKSEEISHLEAKEGEEISSNSDHSRPQNMEEESQQMPSPTKKMRILPPAPQVITRSELTVLESCLSRWQRDVDAQVAELKQGIEELNYQLRCIYENDLLKRIPYRLHAVVVHEGQASGGHYWVYIFDHIRKTWMKFNDIQVTESKWEELLQDSIGGQNNASAYCLLYIDESRYSMLFPQPPESTDTILSNLGVDLQEYVKNDNMAFRREIEAWDNKQREANAAKQQQTPIGTWDNSMSQVPATAPNSPDIICVEPESHFFYEIQTLLVSTVKNYIIEKDKDKDFKCEGKILDSLLESEFHRIRSLAESKSKEPPNSPGIFDFGVYLLCNDVPMDPLVNIYGFEVVWQVCQNATQNTPLVDKLSKEVSQRLAEQKEKYARTNVREEYNNWLKSYRSFLECAWILVYCRQQFEKSNLYKALPLILKACSIHQSLANSQPQGPRKTLDGNVLWKFRRQCLLHLNEKLYNSFKTGDGQDTVSELNSLIVPAMAQISTSRIKEDEDAIAKVRNKWCQLLEEEISSPAKSKMSEQILKIILIELNDIKCVNLPTNVPRHHNVLPLYKQYVDICRVILGPPRQTSDL
ncbi:unnamed protein product [Meganyctiphanes norvegica]|uniref:USP domain-containing protein n=1 Tax=Meganyctiphanes norvegica TaxID=48144 RepID=A0AAV2R750_MEGNR